MKLKCVEEFLKRLWITGNKCLEKDQHIGFFLTLQKMNYMRHVLEEVAEFIIAGVEVATGESFHNDVVR